MAEPQLSEHHLVAPRKLILLVRTTAKGTYEAVTLNGEVAITGITRDEVKEKMRAQVKAMDSHIRPTTVRLHFLEEARTWIMAPSDNDDSNSKDSNKKEKSAEEEARKGKSTKK